MKCIDCKFWEQDVPLRDGEDGLYCDSLNGVSWATDEAEEFIILGGCKRILHGKILTNKEAFTMDGSDYTSSLYTAKDFGCLLFEQRGTVT